MVLDQATTSISKALALTATALPMAPKPKIPSRVPLTPPRGQGFLANDLASLMNVFVKFPISIKQVGKRQFSNGYYVRYCLRRLHFEG